MTLDSGQVFHWEKVGNGFVGAIGDQAVYVEQRGETVRIAIEGGAPATPGSQELAPPGKELIERYFALDHPLAEIRASFPDDPIMGTARNFCRGLRIIRQPKWECLATFICSSMKQVAHIRQISHALRKRFGDRRKIDNHVIHTFPSPERLGQSSAKELRECALGYRARNLLTTARLVALGAADLEALSSLSDVDLREKLCDFPGVGAKVANCVMLFAYERLRAFPIDVWIERVLKERYFPGKRKVIPQRLRAFCESYFGEFGGYAQQYLFHHARKASRNSGAPRDFSTPLRSGRDDKRRDARTASRKSGEPRDSSHLRHGYGGAGDSARNDKKRDARMSRRKR